MGRISKEEKERIRLEIIENSKRMFEENGYDKTSIKAIAQSVGIANGTVFNYFDCKEEIYLATRVKQVESASSLDVTIEKGDSLIDDMISMITHDISQSINVDKKVLSETILVSLKLNEQKKLSFSDLIYLDRSYIKKIKKLLDVYRFNQASMVSEIIYNIIISESLFYVYVESIKKKDLLQDIQKKIEAILINFDTKEVK